MRWQRRPARPSVGAGLRVFLAGTLLLGAVGSCELPKPKLPSIGWAPASTAAVPETPAPPATPGLAVAAPSGPPGEPS